MAFRWQINASSVASLLGHNGPKQQEKVFIDTWNFNMQRLKRSWLAIPDKIENVLYSFFVSNFRTELDIACTDLSRQRQILLTIQKKYKERHMELQNSIQSLNVRLSTISQHTSTTNDQDNPNISNPQLLYWKEKIADKTVELAELDIVLEHGQQWLMNHMNKHRGKKREEADIQLFHSNCNKKFKIATQTDARFLSINCYADQYSNDEFDAFIVGRLDGIDTEKQIVFEMKNRLLQFSRRPLLSDMIQCAIYLKMTGFSTAYLIETCGSEQKTFVLNFKDMSVLQYKDEKNKVKQLFWSDIIRGVRRIVKELNVRLSLTTQ